MQRIERPASSYPPRKFRLFRRGCAQPRVSRTGATPDFEGSAAHAHVVCSVVLRPRPDIFWPGRIRAHRACPASVAAIAVHTDRSGWWGDAVLYPIVENVEIVPVDQIFPVAVRESGHHVEPYEAIGCCLAHGGEDREVQALIGVRADAGVVESLHQ